MAAKPRRLWADRLCRRILFLPDQHTSYDCLADAAQVSRPRPGSRSLGRYRHVSFSAISIQTSDIPKAESAKQPVLGFDGRRGWIGDGVRPTAVSHRFALDA